MFEYRLYYLSDGDDANWKKCGTNLVVEVGDVLELSCGFYHVVCDITKQKTGIRLDMSKSCQSPEEAWLVAEQLKHYPRGSFGNANSPKLRVFEGNGIVEI